MNRSRSTPPRPAEASSLDALSRTIEGLEARIEGLMSSTARDTRPTHETVRERVVSERRARPNAERRDPIAEIRERQRALEAIRQRQNEAAAPAPSREPMAERAHVPAPRAQTPGPAPTHASAPAPALAPAADTKAIVSEITQALLGLRQDLKHDISEGFSREIVALRSEIQGLKSVAGNRQLGEELRDDMARLAKSIEFLGQQAPPAADNLREEFDELRSLMDGLARENSVRDIEKRWTGVEDRLQDAVQQPDPQWLREELIQLFDRLDEIKGQLTTMGDSRAIRALEDKLITVATALEQIGSHIDPNERALQEQFSGIDMRLDEITRAIAAGNRATAPTADAKLIERLEEKLSSLAAQMDALSEGAAQQSDPGAEIAGRLEALSTRIEEMATSRSASHLEERLDQLSQLIEQQQQNGPQSDVTDYLFDISRKIDALDHDSINERLAERLDVLARRIEEIEHPASKFDDGALRGLEDRLSLIAERLEETAQAPAHDSVSLRSLEEQISHLSSLIGNVPNMPAPAMDGDIADRIGKLEDYIATSDEYIVEAARQAAEAVMETFTRQGLQGGITGPQLETITALADNLRHLEDLSRDNEERTQRTFDSLQDTLLQIADRLDSLHHESDVHADARGNYRAEAPREVSRQETELRQANVALSHSLAEAYASEPASAEPETGFYDPSVQAPEDDLVAERTDLEPQSEQKAAKPSLLAGLGKRLRPGNKKDDGSATARQMIEPSPSIDPADIVPQEDANELLEPGTGAPDVRKILERVRASKMSGGAEAASSTDGERTDYIAAARRAAQAAAQEVGRAQAQPSEGTAEGEKGKSAFSRYRRPILLAAGAVLLAVMSMPLIRTLTQGEQSPPPVIENTAPVIEEEQPVSDDLSDAAVDSAPVIEDSSPEGSEPVPEEQTEDAIAPAGAMDSMDAPVDDIQEDTLGAPDNAGAAEPVRLVSPEETAPAEAGIAADVAGTSATMPANTSYDVPADIKPASLAKAASEGDPLAMFEIGARYTDGRGVAADLKEAAKWYQHAADAGFAPAQYRLANLYEKGTGVQQDLDTAMKYYELAAAQGNATSMHNLAVMFASGAAGTQDYARASEWFIQASELGVPDSQFNLAILYARGNGVAQSFVDSYKWFAIAAKDGDKDAADKRDEVARALTPEQLEKAKADVAAWTPKPFNVDANSVNLPDEWAGKGTSTGSVDMKKAIQNVQAILNKNGFEAGTADGIMGEKTRNAIKAFQSSVGQNPSGQIDDALVRELLARNK